MRLDIFQCNLAPRVALYRNDNLEEVYRLKKTRLKMKIYFTNDETMGDNVSYEYS
jgi:hypothetical protein